MNKVLYKHKSVLPNIIKSDKYMVHCSISFFCQNRLNMHVGFPFITLSQGMPLVEESCMSMMDICGPIMETDIRQLLKRSFNVFCAVDLMGTFLGKYYLGVLISPITNIINVSLSLDMFPRLMKAALVKPLIKYHILDCNILNSSTPVSNFTFLSKDIEMTVANI